MNPRRLFVRSGGGIPGLYIYAGMEKALANHGIFTNDENDANSGTSAGAIRGAFDSALFEIDDYIDLLMSLKEKDIRQTRLFWKLRVFFITWYLKNQPIINLIEDNLPKTFEELKIPLYVHATNFNQYCVKRFSSGDLAPAILASMSISGIFPPVYIDNIQYVDGGVVMNLPLLDNWRDFDEVYILIGSTSPKPNGKNMISRLLYNVETLMEDQVNDVLIGIGVSPEKIYEDGHAYIEHGKTKVFVFRPILNSKTSMLRINYDLISQAEEFTEKSLASLKSKCIIS